MEFCEALTHVYGHNNWFNPIHGIGSIGGWYQTPYEAYDNLKPQYQAIVDSLFGHSPSKWDGITEESAPVDYAEFAEMNPGHSRTVIILEAIKFSNDQES